MNRLILLLCLLFCSPLFLSAQSSANEEIRGQAIEKNTSQQSLEKVNMLTKLNQEERKLQEQPDSELKSQRLGAIQAERQALKQELQNVSVDSRKMPKKTSTKRVIPLENPYKKSKKVRKHMEVPARVKK